MQPERIYRELEQNLAILHALASGLDPGEARFKPAPDSWSILEVICHLYDEEREDFRAHLDLILHQRGETWPLIDPGGWVIARSYNERNLAEMLAGFAAERAQSLVWLRSLSAPDWEAQFPAPWGTLKAGDMLASWAAHDTLHMRQLVELRRSRIISAAEPYGVWYAGDW